MGRNQIGTQKELAAAVKAAEAPVPLYNVDNFRTQMKEKMILAGDIGGTKTTLALFEAATRPHFPLAEATFPSASYPGLEVIVREFLTQVDRSGWGNK